MIAAAASAVRRLFGGRKPIFVALPVWGEAYVDVFLKATLPAQLSAGNLPALARTHDCRYMIYTRPEDAERIRASKLFPRLARVARVIFETIPAVDPALDAHTRMSRAYQAKSDCYRDCLARAEREDAPILMFNADILLADGFLRHVAGLLARNKRVLEVPGPRALKDPVLAELASRFRGGDGIITVPPRELARLWIDHIHPLMLRHVWDPSLPPDDFHPSHLYWRVGADGMLAHCFHLYPIMVWPRYRGATFRDTIDDVLVESAAPSMDDTDIPDSDVAFCIELSGPDHHVGRMSRRDDDGSIVGAYLHHGTKRNDALLRRAIRIRGGEGADTRAWAAVEAEAGAVVSRLAAAVEAARPS